MANHGAAVRRVVARHGIEKVEEFIDKCLSLENLVDPHLPFIVRHRDETLDEEPSEIEVPRLAAKDYMDSFINPDEYIEEERKKLEAQREAKKEKFPAERTQDVLLFLLDHAPLERWEHVILSIIREEAYYFVPQMQTKVMNEGWASYFHSKLMTRHVADASEIVDYAENNAGVMATSRGQLNPYKLGVELFRHIEERWDRGQFGREWEECDNLDAKKNWDLRLGLGQRKIFEVRQLYTDVTFIDEFFTPDFAHEHGYFAFGWSSRNERWEIESREFKQVKEKLLANFTNFGNPFIYVQDANYENRGELLLMHEHRGIDLRADYAREALSALVRIWKRPVVLSTIIEGKGALIRFDGKEHSITNVD